MNFPFFFGLETATVVDPIVSTWVGLIGNLGPTAGTVAALYICAGLMQRESKMTREWVAGLIDQMRSDSDRREESHRIDSERREAVMRETLSRQADVIREFSKSANGICRYAGPVIAPSRSRSQA